jgi:hypothetical protein
LPCQELAEAAVAVPQVVAAVVMLVVRKQLLQ